MDQKPQNILVKVTGFFVLDSQHPDYLSGAPRIECMVVLLPQTSGTGYAELGVCSLPF